MGLSGQQRKELQLALIDAFPDIASLERMLAYELEGKNLRAIAGEGSLQNIVFELIKKANAQGWVKELIDAACRENPGNQLLKATAQELLSNQLEANPVTLPKTSVQEAIQIPQKTDNPSHEYDVFISHASEDKDSFVRPLAKKLQDRGYRVWYDEFSLKLGDSLSNSIDKGLANARYGIVVLSHNFFKKKWTQRELNGLTAREVGSENKVILPIWHDIEYQDIVNYSPTLADKLGVKTSLGMDYVVNKIVEVL
ncbi:MAG: toll/interleukin-1 receptor domain-containing protein [Calothrix sp. FI2-JRJ7]|jgi:hypothetical protein|nr:toll/interleukin-1 receptor domain-containing protein [Calothrix sp. FI2-JRJ7]